MTLFRCCHFTAICCCFVLPVIFRFIEGCSPVQETPGLRLSLLRLEETMSITNFAMLDLETITQQPRGASRTVRRAAFGRPYILSTEGDTKLRMESNFSVIWEHNDRQLIFSKMVLNRRTNDSSNTFALTVLEDSVELLFYNVTPTECGKHKLTVDEGHGVFLYSTTYVRLKWNFTSIFYRPMDNATASMGETINLRCYVQVAPGPFNIFERVIWRVGNRVLHAPKSHSMASLIDRDSVSRDYDLSSLKDTHSAWIMILSIKSAHSSVTGRYECWYKPDAETDEWLVQSSYVRLK